VIAEELGRACAPMPFSSSVYLATEALLLAGSPAQKEKWLPKLAAGEVIGTFAMPKAPAPCLAEEPRDPRGRRQDHRHQGAGAGRDVAQLAVVVRRSTTAATAPRCSSSNSRPRRDVTPVPTLDPTRGHAGSSSTAPPAEPLGKPGQGWALTRSCSTAPPCCSRGSRSAAAQAALEQAREYALGRYAFGRPIASYQAIKHKLANMYVKNTLARSNCYYGAWALNTDAQSCPWRRPRRASRAIQAYYFASKENIQTHGGMGYTWEFDCQFYYRRAKLLSVNIGSEAQLAGQADHRRRAEQRRLEHPFRSTVMDFNDTRGSSVP
jgi:acyl-CoA dehydrogenase